MTELDIINAARVLSKQSEIPESSVRQDKIFYDLYLEDLLKERDWLFAIAKSTRLVLTKPAIDLGYKYVYSLGNTDVEDIISINNPRQVILTDFRDSLRYGFTTDPASELTAGQTQSFIFVNGLLHSSTPVEQVFYKRKVQPINMEDSFKLLLIYTLAEHMASHKKDNPELEDRLRRKKENQHVRATRFEHQRPKNRELAEIYDFIRNYRTQTNLRYN